MAFQSGPPSGSLLTDVGAAAAAYALASAVRRALCAFPLEWTELTCTVAQLSSWVAGQYGATWKKRAPRIVSSSDKRALFIIWAPERDTFLPPGAFAQPPNPTFADGANE
jgi:hypothetical protein